MIISFSAGFLRHPRFHDSLEFCSQTNTLRTCLRDHYFRRLVLPRADWFPMCPVTFDQIPCTRLGLFLPPVCIRVFRSRSADTSVLLLRTTLLEGRVSTTTSSRNFDSDDRLQKCQKCLVCVGFNRFPSSGRVLSLALFLGHLPLPLITTELTGREITRSLS